jgi:hypothetical protein
MDISVLWLDDEFDSEALKSTFIRMEKHFRLIKCYTKDEFLDKIESEEWDAIVLDVLDPNGRDSGFQTAVRRILKEYKDEPWFVFSGQENVTKKESDIRAMLAEEDCHREYADILYIKSEHNDELINDIKNAVSEKPTWQLKNKYSKVLCVFDDNIQGKEQLFDILLMLHGLKHLDHHTYYTQLRLIMEWMFRDANKRGLLHDKCIDEKGKVNLTESSLFMAGRPTKYHGVCCDIAHFPKIIADNVKNLLEITGGASHTAEPDKKELINLQTYWEQVNTPYQLYSLTFMLCDILIWYKEYADANNDYVANVTLWKSIESVQPLEKNIVSGVITNFDSAGRAFLQPDGATQRKENCSIDPKKFIGVDIKIDNRFTVEFEEREIAGKDPIRIVVRIISTIN